MTTTTTQPNMFTAAQLATMIEAHHKWLTGVDGGSRADLTGAILTGADLRGADLSRADLTDAILRGADLTGADLSRADLTDADLSRADLTGADLRGADLSRAILSRADLTGADLRGADLTGAILSRADLTDADLSRADLTGAILTDADLTGADLTDVKEDLFEILNHAPGDVEYLLATLRTGNIDGSSYQTSCNMGCLVGTIAYSQGRFYNDLPGISPNSSRSAERWFLAIRPGDTPDNSEIAKITEGWIVEWLVAHPVEAA